PVGVGQLRLDRSEGHSRPLPAGCHRAGSPEGRDRVGGRPRAGGWPRSATGGDRRLRASGRPAMNVARRLLVVYLTLVAAAVLVMIVVPVCCYGVRRVRRGLMWRRFDRERDRWTVAEHEASIP